MGGGITVRRHADGALDIGHFRRRAARLRSMARRRAWRSAQAALKRVLARLRALPEAAVPGLATPRY